MLQLNHLVFSQRTTSEKRHTPIRVDGESLDIARTAAFGKFGGIAYITSDRKVLDRIDACVARLDHEIKEGKTVYGVNTGYGGSADVRCTVEEMDKLQTSFVQHLNCGVLPRWQTPNNIEVAHSPSLKIEWVRAAMLIRANTLARGHSAVSLQTICNLLSLVTWDVIPIIPTRGSISASGDLTPLSYVAGMLEGSPAIYCSVGSPCWVDAPPNRRVMPASSALEFGHLKPTVFKPKEALGLVNGTAISAAAATLTLASMNNILALSQLLTAMNVEAACGSVTSFAPFISTTRPHAGQAQVASTIFAALQGSKLATGLLKNHNHTLFQDRYSLRTVTQWLGPFVEDIIHANTQLAVELNSTTDNPLIDTSTGDIYHGGNFQAVSVTSAMEKCRLAAQAIGRMLFYQFTEMTDPAKNRGLPPNLCVDEPSTSFTFKGVDTNMAGYMSELSFLANPVHNHGVSAEMGNQTLNSLALISARYTDTAMDILSIMCACTLYGTCQALDLRAMARIFMSRLRHYIHNSLLRVVYATGVGLQWYSKAKAEVWESVSTQFNNTSTLDSKDRFETIMKSAKSCLLSVLEGANANPSDLMHQVSKWTADSIETSLKLFNETRQEYLESGDASKFLGRASKRLYHFVRKDLGVKMHKGVVDHPTYEASGDTNTKWTIGHWISVINDAIQDERIMEVVVQCLKEGMNEQDGRTSNRSS